MYIVPVAFFNGEIGVAGIINETSKLGGRERERDRDLIDLTGKRCMFPTTMMNIVTWFHFPCIHVFSFTSWS